MPDTFPVYVACVQDARYSERPFRETTVTVDRDRREVLFKRRFAFGRMGRGRSIGRDVCLVYMKMKQDWHADAYATDRGVMRRPIVSSYTTRENEPYHAILIGIQDYDELICFIVFDDRDNDYTVTMWMFPGIKYRSRDYHYPELFWWSEELLSALYGFLREVNQYRVQVLGDGVNFAQRFILKGRLLRNLRPLKIFVKLVREWWGPRVRSENMELAILDGRILVYGPLDVTTEATYVQHYALVIARFLRAEGFKDAFPVLLGSTGILVDPVWFEYPMDGTARNRSHHLVTAHQWGECRNDSVFLFVIREWTGESPA
jgi:hypothetical protein